MKSAGYLRIWSDAVTGCIRRGVNTHVGIVAELEPRQLPMKSSTNTEVKVTLQRLVKIGRVSYCRRRGTWSVP